MNGDPNIRDVDVTVTHVGRTTVHMQDSKGTKYMFMREDRNFPNKPCKVGDKLKLTWRLKRWYVA